MHNQEAADADERGPSALPLVGLLFLPAGIHSSRLQGPHDTSQLWEGVIAM